MTGKGEGSRRSRGVSTAQIKWGVADEPAAPFSVLFDDIYYTADGAAEAEHVFVAGNDLRRRFPKAHEFTIGELGFGVGLNFLVAAQAFRNCAPNGARLSFLSVEKHPLEAASLARAHSAFAPFAADAERLRACLPPPAPGLHAVAFDEQIRLLLYYGDVAAGLDAVEARVDAWFLDGFAPAKNPEMWTPEIFQRLAGLSRPSATAATFTVAGAVRRGLADAGFEVEKRPGFGRKREMLAARLHIVPPPAPVAAPWFACENPSPAPRGARIAIVGGGIAGASLAHALTQAGFAPVIFDPEGAAAGASGNPAGLIAPRLDAADTPTARFHLAAYLHTIQMLTDIAITAPDVFNPCGVDLFADDEASSTRLDAVLSSAPLPADWLAPADPDGSAGRVGRGVRLPQAGVVDPPRFVRALLGVTPLRREAVCRLSPTSAGVAVITADGAEEFDAAVLANGVDALRFVQARSLPLTPVIGQIEHFPDARGPASAIAFGPYVAPAPGGGLVLGATYERPTASLNGPGGSHRATPPPPRLQATQNNLAAVARLAPDIASTLDPAASRPRTGLRCQTPDRLPVVGPLPDWAHYATVYDELRFGRKLPYPPGRAEPRLFILAGLGSRGLVTAPLAAAMIAAELAGAAAPVERATRELLHPARFFIRSMKRARPTRPA